MFGKGKDLSKTGGAELVETAPTQEQLIEMFQKRNLMKRAYDKAAEELKQTKLELEHLRATSDQNQKRLNVLDDALIDPEKAQSVVAWYQLEPLRQRVMACLSEQLAAVRGMHEAEEQQAHLQAFIAKQRDRIALSEVKIGSARDAWQAVANQREGVLRDLAAAQKIWHYFKRKRLSAQLAELEAALEPLDKKRKEAEDEAGALRREEAPKFPGLSLKAKRAVNLRLIAAAQYFYMELIEDNLAPSLAKSQGTQPGAVSFGYTPDCLALVKAANAITPLIGKDPDIDTRISAREAALAPKVHYAKAEDTLPAPGSIDVIDASIAPKAVSAPASGLQIPGAKPAAPASGFGQILGGGAAPAASVPGAIRPSVPIGDPRIDVVADNFCGLRELVLT